MNLEFHHLYIQCIEQMAETYLPDVVKGIEWNAFSITTIYIRLQDVSIQ